MLPSIMEVAQQHGLQINARSQSAKEIRSKCPFCEADAHKKDKYYLSLNTSDNVFKCWACGESGGVLKLIALLEGKSMEEIKRNLWGERRAPRQLHPAEKLTPLQLKAMGFVGCGWGKLKRDDPDRYKRTLDWVWSEWQAYSREIKRLAYMGLLSQNTTEEIRYSCKDYAQRIGVSTEELLLELMTIRFSRQKPEWAKSAEWFVDEAKKSEKHSSPDRHSLAG